jgi:transcriptional regulator with XRE-family HTH domain
MYLTGFLFMISVFYTVLKDSNMADKHDVVIGQNIRSHRWNKGITQQKLAEYIGVRFQQVQKYETAKSRVSASRLYRISKALDVNVEDFFIGLGETETELVSSSSENQ